MDDAPVPLRRYLHLPSLPPIKLHAVGNTQNGCAQMILRKRSNLRLGANPKTLATPLGVWPISKFDAATLRELVVAMTVGTGWSSLKAPFWLVAATRKTGICGAEP